MDKKGYKVKSIKNSIKVLESFSVEKLSLNLTELTEKTNINKTTLFRILSNLEESCYILKNVNTKKYQLGIKLFELGQLVQREMIIRDISLPIMKGLSYLTKETIGLDIAIGEKRATIEKIESSHVVRHTIELGKLYPLYAGANSKILLAFSSEDKIKKIVWKDKLVAFTDKTITDPAKLESNLFEIKKKGYAVSIGEIFNNSTAIAVPILKNNKKAIAALFISGPSERFDGEKISRIIKLLKNSANNISKKIGYSVIK